MVIRFFLCVVLFINYQSLVYRYPIFIDAAAQSMGNGFVGTYKSTMSLMGARRVVDWQGGVWREVNWNDYGKEDSVKFVRHTRAVHSFDDFVI